MGTPADRLPDEVLLAGLGTGDPELAIAFVRRFQQIVFGVAVTVIGDRTTAEDVAQQAFERALAARARVRLAPRVRPGVADHDHA